MKLFNDKADQMNTSQEQNLTLCYNFCCKWKPHIKQENVSLKYLLWDHEDTDTNDYTTRNMQ